MSIEIGIKDYLLVLSFILFISCGTEGNKYHVLLNDENIKLDHGSQCTPLLASRIKNLDHLKSVVNISYDRDYSKLDSSECNHSSVRLIYESNGEVIDRLMHSGINQSDLQKIQTADIWTKLLFIIRNSDLVRERKSLEQINYLSRKREEIFGSRASAFYLIAEAMVNNINTPRIAFKTYKDSLEKGYINTFNHIIAQAIMTTIFSKELADKVGDLHELQNMPELTCGIFSKIQLEDTINNPVDNYIDIINNEIGQKLGERLRSKYCLQLMTDLTPNFFSDYINDLQNYFAWGLNICFTKFQADEEVIIKFTNKLNIIRNSFD